MKKLVSIIILSLFSQLLVINAIAGTDGEVEITSKKKKPLLKTCITTAVPIVVGCFC